jgi:trigger factor
MNISLERAENAVAGKLTVTVNKEDYQGKVVTSLKKIKQKAQMPGFRKGMVPMGLVQKMYGTEVKAEEIQKLLTDTVNEYINNEKLNVLGEPMLADDNSKMNIESDEEFNIKFDLVFAPEISVKLDGRTTVDYYNINVDNDAVNKQIEQYSHQNGTHVEADEFAEDDLLKGSLVENAEGENALRIDEVSLMPRFFSNDEQKGLFVSAKKDSDIVFSPSKAYDGREAELASLLKTTREEAVKHDGDFTFHINVINHFEPAKVDKSLFDAVYHGADIKTEEEFAAKVKSDIEEQYKQDSDYKFLIDLKAVAMKKAGGLPLAEDLLKKMALQNAKSEETKKQIEEHFADYLTDLRWSLVRKDLVKSFGIKIDEAAMMSASKKLIRIQMAQYGILNLPEEQLEQFAAERIKDPKAYDGILTNAIDSALVSAAKKVVKLKENSVSIAEFNKMFE